MKLATGSMLLMACSLAFGQANVPTIPFDSVPDPIAQLMVLNQQLGGALFARSQSRSAFRSSKRGDHDVRLVRADLQLDPGAPVMARTLAAPTPDTHTVTVRVRGMDPATGTRFVRIDQASIYAS